MQVTQRLCSREHLDWVLLIEAQCSLKVLLLVQAVDVAGAVLVVLKLPKHLVVTCW